MERAFAAPYEPTPALGALTSALDASDWVTVVSTMDAHWAEVWYAVDPADLRTVLSTMPAEHVAQMTQARFLLDVSGLSSEVSRPAADVDAVTHVEFAAQRIADLRLQGKPLEALKVAERFNASVLERRGRLVDTSEGKAALWSVQVGISALLAGELQTAEGAFLSATEARRPARFPFVRREAAAKLALTKALAAQPDAAREWAERARSLPRTASWVEPMIDDSLWLTDYLLAVDALDLERAEAMRRERPSPLEHLEFWGVALQAHVRHLALTGRNGQAIALCDAMDASGLPMTGSDGWLAQMSSDARLHALSDGDRTIRLPRTAEAVLAQRVGAFVDGHLPEVVVPLPDLVHVPRSQRAELSLRLLRAQAFHGLEPTEATRQDVLEVLTEIADRGLFSILRNLSTDTLASLTATDEAVHLAELVRQHDLPLLSVQPVASTPLTPTEVTVLEHLSAGLSRQQIADVLVVSLSTVKTHLRTAYRKLGANNRSDAVAALERLQVGSRRS